VADRHLVASRKDWAWNRWWWHSAHPRRERGSWRRPGAKYEVRNHTLRIRRIGVRCGLLGHRRDRSVVEIARERTRGGDFRVGDMEALPRLDDTFDLSVAAVTTTGPQGDLEGLGLVRRLDLLVPDETDR
jgi:hypothetical protein